MSKKKEIVGIGGGSYTTAIALTLLVLVIVIVHYYVVLKPALREREKYMDGMLDVQDPKFDDPSLSFPTKCVSCERQFPVGKRWAAQPTKCFACERHMLAAGGHEAAQNTHPNKCFACESS